MLKSLPYDLSLFHFNFKEVNFQITYLRQWTVIPASTLNIPLTIWTLGLVHLASVTLFQKNPRNTKYLADSFFFCFFVYLYYQSFTLLDKWVIIILHIRILSVLCKITKFYKGSSLNTLKKNNCDAIQSIFSLFHRYTSSSQNSQNVNLTPKWNSRFI